MFLTTTGSTHTHNRWLCTASSNITPVQTLLYLSASCQPPARAPALARDVQQDESREWRVTSPPQLEVTESDKFGSARSDRDSKETGTAGRPLPLPPSVRAPHPPHPGNTSVRINPTTPGEHTSVSITPAAPERHARRPRATHPPHPSPPHPPHPIATHPSHPHPPHPPPLSDTPVAPNRPPNPPPLSPPHPLHRHPPHPLCTTWNCSMMVSKSGGRLHSAGRRPHWPRPAPAPLAWPLCAPPRAPPPPAPPTPPRPSPAAPSAGG
eukprot:12312-Prorocentrum_minimum.AAC.1